MPVRSAVRSAFRSHVKFKGMGGGGLEGLAIWGRAGKGGKGDKGDKGKGKDKGDKGKGPVLMVFLINYP